MRSAQLISVEANRKEQWETYNEAEAQDIRQCAEVGRNLEEDVGWKGTETQVRCRRARALPSEETVGSAQRGGDIVHGQCANGARRVGQASGEDGGRGWRVGGRWVAHM